MPDPSIDSAQWRANTVNSTPRTTLALAGYILLILAAGLNPRSHQFSNDANIQNEGTGLRFQGNGLAFTAPFAIAQASDQSTDATIVVAVNPDPAATRGFQFISAITRDHSVDQLLLVQWHDQLAVMTGDDYDHSEKKPRLTTTIDDTADSYLLLAIRLDESGAALYLNGERVSSQAVGISLPSDFSGLRVVLGNDPDGRYPWSGSIAGFALYEVAMDSVELKELWRLWSQQQQFSGLPTTGAVIFYDFLNAENEDGVILDGSVNGHHLQIPDDRVFIAPRFADFELSSTPTTDLLVNLLGFMPFGYLLSLWWSNRANKPISLFMVCLCSALLSASIELSQAWIPARDSNLLDFLLNIAGALAGAGLHRRRWQPNSTYAAGEVR